MGLQGILTAPTYQQPQPSPVPAAANHGSDAKVSNIMNEYTHVQHVQFALLPRGLPLSSSTISSAEHKVNLQAISNNFGPSAPRRIPLSKLLEEIKVRVQSQSDLPVSKKLTIDELRTNAHFLDPEICDMIYDKIFTAKNRENYFLSLEDAKVVLSYKIVEKEIEDTILIAVLEKAIEDLFEQSPPTTYYNYLCNILYDTFAKIKNQELITLEYARTTISKKEGLKNREDLQKIVEDIFSKPTA